MAKFLKASRISKKHGQTLTLQPLDLHLKTGQIIVLCGGNGAGKSTCIRMLAGVDCPTSGTVQIEDDRVKTFRLDAVHNRIAYVREVGYMPDDYQFGNVLTAMEILHTFAQLKGYDRDEVIRVATIVGLGDKLQLRASTYSKGMRQRLLLAQALIGNPTVVILDEPTNGLDPLWNKQLREIIVGLREDNRAVIVSTHDLSFAEAVADYGIFMDDGNVIVEGPMSDIIERVGDDGLISLF
jgi:ABC-type multidrug transport system ATPase subunit